MTDVFAKTDWALLAQQKLALLQAIDCAPDSEQNLLLTGLLHFIDAVQDAAEADGHPVVWLTTDEEECEHEYRTRRYCGVLVCTKCDDHKGLERCYCGWSKTSPGHGREELIDMGERIEEDE